jgi:hypothetical protein
MAGNDEVTINGWPWNPVNEANSRVGWGYQESLVRECGGDPREVERRTGVEITENKATSMNAH